jgi:2'-hydroxyisoflavone reductase
MKLLVIGGTVFVGRAVVEEALRRGHSVTLFNRAQHGAELFAGEVERVQGDRTQGMGELAGRAFDALIDTCLFDPAHVAELDVGTYVFVSTGGVYRDWPMAAGDESFPLHETGEDYSELKAAAERRLEEVYPGRVLHGRAGVIVGPHENIGRLPWWLKRMERGGEVLAPGPPQAPIQLIDARDLAAFLLDAAERGLAGPYNLIAPPGYASWGELLELAREVVNPSAQLVWADRQWVAEKVEDSWTELPLWPTPEYPGLYLMDPAKAIADGLAIRGLGETIRDTWKWLAGGGELDGWRSELRAGGLAPEAEEALLRELRRP